MSRGLSASNLTEISAANVYPVCFWYGDFASGAVRITTHNQDITWGGHTWTALGDLVGVEEIKEGSTDTAPGTEFRLNGVNPTLLTKALEAGFRRRDCSFYIGYLNSSGALVADPIEYPFIMDRMPIRRDGKEASIRVIAESWLVDMQRSSELRNTDSQQQYLFAGDLFFEYVEGQIDKSIPVGGEVSGGAGVQVERYNRASVNQLV